MGRDFVLGLLVVFERVDLDMTNVLRFLLVRTDGDCKHVFVEWVPDDAGDHLGGFGVFRV